jgi:lipoate-protein ligase B
MVSAYVADLGRTDYMDTLYLQQKLAEMRHEGTLGRDIILLTEHHPAILFGQHGDKNSFSKEFLQKIEESGKTHKEYLNELGIAFHDNLQYGGGAAYIGPGHLMVYPINDHTRLFPQIDIARYKNLVDRTMLQVMHDFGIKDAYIAEGFNPETNRERRDVWYNIGEKSHKIAAKGVYYGLKVAHHGFQIYVSNEGLKHFWIVDPCGYRHEQVSVISMEDIIGYEPHMDHVKESVKNSVQKHFQYERLEPCHIAKYGDTVKIIKL